MRHGHQFLGIGGLDRAAVENAQPVTFARQQFAQAAAQECVHFGHIGGAGRQPGADGPDRLIRNDRVGRSRTLGQRPRQLPAGYFQRQPRRALPGGFANAHDGG